MSETLLRIETPRQKAIDALEIIQELEFPITRDELPGFLSDIQLTEMLKAILEENGKVREGSRNPNHLIYPSIVRGELVPRAGTKANFFFAALYTGDQDDYPTKIGLYHKDGKDPRNSYGLDLPINEDGSLDIEAWRNANHARYTRRAGAAIKSGAIEMLEALTLSDFDTHESELELMVA
jgi:hypothetical protein